DGTVEGVILDAVDFFTPSNQLELNSIDMDLGSAGPILLPGTQRLLGGGKEGWMYLLDRDNLGKYHAPPSPRPLRAAPLPEDKVVSSFQAGVNTYIPNDADLTTRFPSPTPGDKWGKW